MKFIEWLLGAKEDKVCKTCLVLEEQLDYERASNKELLDTLTSLLKPVPIIQQSSTTPVPVSRQGMLWSRRRIELEKQDRESARIKVGSPVIGRPDIETAKPVEQPKTIDELETELGVSEGS